MDMRNNGKGNEKSNGNGGGSGSGNGAANGISNGNGFGTGNGNGNNVGNNNGNSPAGGSGNDNGLGNGNGNRDTWPTEVQVQVPQWCMEQMGAANAIGIVGTSGQAESVEPMSGRDQVPLNGGSPIQENNVRVRKQNG